MNKHLMRLIYLARQSDTACRTTENIHLFVNRVPCDEEEYFSAKPAELYVIGELQEYPINIDIP